VGVEELESEEEMRRDKREIQRLFHVKERGILVRMEEKFNLTLEW